MPNPAQAIRAQFYFLSALATMMFAASANAQSFGPITDRIDPNDSVDVELSGRYTYLGSTWLTRELYRDFVVPRDACFYDKVMIRVKRNRARIWQIAVRYAGTRTWDTLDIDSPGRDRIFSRGEASALMDLRGGRRCIDAVKVVGESAALFDRRRNRDEALVRIWGVKTLSP